MTMSPFGYDPEVIRTFWRDFHNRLADFLVTQFPVVPLDRFSFNTCPSEEWQKKFCYAASKLLVAMAYRNMDIPEDLRRWRIDGDFSRVYDLRLITLWAVDPSGGRHDISELAGL
jgi:hypothetical protein